MHNELVHHFLKNHPHECAREIENFTLDDILSFISLLSKKETADIISCLIPSIAAVCLQHLSLDKSKEIIKILPLNSLKKIMPRFHEELRMTFMEVIPKNQRVALQHVLRFSQNTVGTLMNTEVLFLPIEHNIAQAISLVKDFSQEINAIIFCIDNRGELQGMLKLTDIMLAAPEQMIGTLIEDCPLILLTNTNIQSVALHDIWQQYPILPVTDENKILLGVLEYNKVVHEIQQQLFGDRKENIADSLTHIMFMFSHAAENMLNELSNMSSRK